MVSDVFISDGKVYFSITVPAERAKELEPAIFAAERVIKEMPGVKGALVALTADKKGAPSGAAASRTAAAGRAGPSGSRARPAATARRQDRRSRHRCHRRSGVGQGRRRQVHHIRQFGTGLQANGLRVGILDADIYGLSSRVSCGSPAAGTQTDGRIINPMENYGLKVMSMGSRRRGNRDDLARSDGSWR